MPHSPALPGVPRPVEDAFSQIPVGPPELPVSSTEDSFEVYLKTSKLPLLYIIAINTFDGVKGEILEALNQELSQVNTGSRIVSEEEHKIRLKGILNRIIPKLLRDRIEVVRSQIEEWVDSGEFSDLANPQILKSRLNS